VTHPFLLEILATAHRQDLVSQGRRYHRPLQARSRRASRRIAAVTDALVDKDVGVLHYDRRRGPTWSSLLKGKPKAHGGHAAKRCQLCKP
jgi:hypothetical protein